MLAVVVDDHDMGATHVIRGDDHLNNAFRQYHLYKACGWDVPEFVHIPLIHAADGAKLSKRHGALGVEHYAELGILPEAMRNYLLRLGWSHGDDEVISTAQAIEWFNLDSVGRSPARFDMDKLLNLNAHYLKEADPADLAAQVLERARAGTEKGLSSDAQARLEKGMPGLAKRANTILDIIDSAALYLFDAPLDFNDKALSALADAETRARLAELAEIFAGLGSWSEDDLDKAVRSYAESRDIKLGQVAQPLRAALTGSNVSPGIFEVLAVLGREESLTRLRLVTE